MAVDEILLDFVGRGISGPTLRAYTWRPRAVSLGRSQRKALRLDPDKCRSAGVDVVVRPSGGRAVLHGEDVTYAAIFPVRGPLEGDGVQTTYRRLAAVLLDAFRRLGAACDLAPTRDLGGPLGALPCFTGAARDEILVGGRKLVGSAQRRTKDAVLQHGAILVRGDQAELASLVDGSRESKTLRENLNGRTVTLEEVLKREITFYEVAEALRAGAEEVLGTPVKEGVLTQEELAAVEKNIRETPGGFR